MSPADFTVGDLRESVQGDVRSIFIHYSIVCYPYKYPVSLRHIPKQE